MGNLNNYSVNIKQDFKFIVIKTFFAHKLITSIFKHRVTNILKLFISFSRLEIFK